MTSQEAVSDESALTKTTPKVSAGEFLAKLDQDLHEIGQHLPIEEFDCATRKSDALLDRLPNSRYEGFRDVLIENFGTDWLKGFASPRLLNGTSLFYVDENPLDDEQMLQLSEIWRGMAILKYATNAHLRKRAAESLLVLLNDYLSTRDSDLMIAIHKALPHDALKSASELAEHFGLDHERLRKVLERFRAKNRDCFEESTGQGAGTGSKVQFRYKYAYVKPVIDKMRRETSAKRPSENS